jgi:hypothetical protein
MNSGFTECNLVSHKKYNILQNIKNKARKYILLDKCSIFQFVQELNVENFNFSMKERILYTVM